MKVNLSKCHLIFISLLFLYGCDSNYSNEVYNHEGHTYVKEFDADEHVTNFTVYIDSFEVYIFSKPLIAKQNIEFYAHLNHVVHNLNLWR